MRLDAAGRRSRPRILAERSQLQMAQPSVYLQLRSFGQNRRFAASHPIVANRRPLARVPPFPLFLRGGDSSVSPVSSVVELLCS